MADEYLTCPFCGFAFQKEDTLCAHGCPLGTMCTLVRCPNCRYEYPERPRLLTWLDRLLHKPKQPARPEHLMTARDLRGGDRATVVSVAEGHGRRRHTLAVFGIVPGAEVLVVQQRPTPVLRVGETDLAIEPDIARHILVQRDNHAPRPTEYSRPPGFASGSTNWAARHRARRGS